MVHRTRPRDHEVVRTIIQGLSKDYDKCFKWATSKKYNMKIQKKNFARKKEKSHMEMVLYTYIVYYI